MPQQINLYNPILLTPRRVFSAATMAMALALVVASVVAVSGWAAWRTHALRTELAASAAALAAERQSLSTALARLPSATGDASALEQEVAAARQRLTERERLRDELSGTPQDGGPVALLGWLARTLPPPVWLSEVRLDGRRIELAGTTLEPEALRRWLDRWAPPGAPADGPPALLRVERDPAADGAVRESWTFRVVQGGAVDGGRR